MDSMIKKLVERAYYEVLAAEVLKKSSEDVKVKEEFDLSSEVTFYSSVISHSYYAIFYSAKAILLSKGVETSSPNVHKATFDAFKEKLVDTGILDLELLDIYRRIVVRADALLEIFRDEKKKRGEFTYNTISQANKGPAEDSLNNAKVFVFNINKVLRG